MRFCLGLIVAAAFCCTAGSAPSDGAFSCQCVLPDKESSLPAGVGPRPPLTALGEKRLLLYRVDFPDFIGAAISSNSAAALLGDLHTYYHSMSYGLMSIAAAQAGSVVTATLRLAEPSSAYNNDFPKLLDATRQAAADAGYAPEEFDSDMVLTGSKPFLVFGAVAYMGGRGVWIGNNNFNVGVAGHELGHNLGLPHASFWSTGDQSSIGPGALVEYGDPFDSMGVPGGNTSHFNARYKHFLGWIPDADAPAVETNGSYRVTAHDDSAAAGVRALRVPRTDTQDYWIEFRQAFNNRWVTNGATLRWAGPGGENTLLIDTTPGTPSTRQDSTVLIGRTFSDRCLDLHITPVGKVGTSPEALDLVIQQGPFPGNLAPVVTVTASATNAALGAVVTLQATATDVDGDSLAYYWDFGDGSFGGNEAVIQHSWLVEGEYVVRCAVTDMKGGTASATVIVGVGTVATYLAEGTVWRDGAGAEGVLVKAGSRFTYTDSDGRYRLSRLGAGRQTLLAVLEAFDVLNASFENPVALGSDAAGLDFVALPSDLNSISLIPAGSVWRYLDTGVVPESAWTSLDYDASGWASGPAKLGYGTGNEATVVGYGTNAANRYVTTWFRRRFVAEDVPVIDHLLFRLRRDDGAVVYLNGEEIYRENMPAGPVEAATLASADVPSFEEQMFFKRLFPPTGLNSGTNILAVEIHQSQTNSVDLSFDLELLGITEDASQLRPRLFSERMGGEVLIRWPAAYGGWLPYTGDAISAFDAWARLSGQVISSNGWNAVYLAPTNEAAFFHLRKPGFCAPVQ